MQPESFANPDLLERNFFLLRRSLSRGLDVGLQYGVFFPQEKPLYSPPASFWGWYPLQVTLQLLGKVFAKFCLCHSSLPWSGLGVSLVARIPDLFIRKNWNCGSTKSLCPRDQILARSHGAERQIVSRRESDAGRVVPGMGFAISQGLGAGERERFSGPTIFLAFSFLSKSSPCTSNLMDPIFWCSEGRRLHYIEVKHTGI